MISWSSDSTSFSGLLLVGKSSGSEVGSDWQKVGQVVFLLRTVPTFVTAHTFCAVSRCPEKSRVSIGSAF